MPSLLCRTVGILLNDSLCDRARNLCKKAEKDAGAARLDWLSEDRAYIVVHTFAMHSSQPSRDGAIATALRNTIELFGPPFEVQLQKCSAFANSEIFWEVAYHEELQALHLAIQNVTEPFRDYLVLPRYTSLLCSNPIEISGKQRLAIGQWGNPFAGAEMFKANVPLVTCANAESVVQLPLKSAWQEVRELVLIAHSDSQRPTILDSFSLSANKRPVDIHMYFPR